MKGISNTAYILTALLMLLCTAVSFAQTDNVNYFYEEGAWLDIIDNVGDDKGPGYYQYPLDRRLRRGTFDLRRLKVFEEGEVVVFEIQMRNYIMREWPDTSKSEDQGFVANMWDIYIDIDGRENSGYKMALPGRDLMFSDNLGWEKVVMITPLSEFELFDILYNKTDELDFQNRVDDIVYPDYVKVQRDKMIVKISKRKLPGISERSGYQCLAMGYSRIVSPNRMLNRDVRGFPTQDDFGGGNDSYGDPPVMDIIVPEGEDQYQLLRDFRSEPYREMIRYASIPFVFAGGKKQASGLKPAVKEPVGTLGINIPPPAITPPSITPPAITPPTTTTARPTSTVKPAPTVTQNSSGFVPLKTGAPAKPKNGFKPIPKAPDGFIPVKKKE